MPSRRLLLFFKRVLLTLICVFSFLTVSTAGFLLFWSVPLLYFGYRFLIILVIVSSNSGVLSSVLTEPSYLASFLAWEYILKNKDYRDSRQFASRPNDKPHYFVYDSRYGVDLVTGADVRIKR